MNTTDIIINGLQSAITATKLILDVWRDEPGLTPEEARARVEAALAHAKIGAREEADLLLDMMDDDWEE